MARQRKRFWVNRSKGVVLGRFHELMPGNVTGNPPMFELCTHEEARFETIDGQRRERSEAEYEAFLASKHKAKLAEIGSDPRFRLSLQRRTMNALLIGKALQQWLEETRLFNSPLTFKEYRKLQTTYLDLVGDHPLVVFDRSHENRFREGLARKRLGRNTQRKYLSHLQTFLYWAADADLIDRRIKLKMPTKLKREHGVYRTEDLRRIRSFLEDSYAQERHPGRKVHRRNHLRLFHMLLATGMRGGEVRHLLLERIDLRRNVIRICTVDAYEAGRHVFWEPKGKKEASIPISRELRGFLEEDLEQRAAQERWYLDDSRGCMAYTGSSSISAPFAKAKKKLGLDEVKPVHGFRSTVITELLNSGQPITKVQKLARHADIQTTRSYYNAEQAELQDLVDSLSMLD